MKIIGWGGLVANSWNSDWGDKGFFKLKRGVDECMIEHDVIAEGWSHFSVEYVIAVKHTYVYCIVYIPYV